MAAYNSRSLRIITWLIIFCLFVCARAFGASADAPNMSPQDALALLKKGNEAFVRGKPGHPDQGISRRAAVAAAQHPFAVIVSCSDSRVPPEIIFDRGLGDLFVVRDAGNVVWDVEIGSIEYAAEHLGVRLVVVLGHKRCGAVSAAVQGAGDEAGHIGSILKIIAPAVDAVKGAPGDEIDNAVRANVTLVRDRLRGDEPVLARMVKENKLKIVGAYYDLDTGAVEFIPEDAAGRAQK